MKSWSTVILNYLNIFFLIRLLVNNFSVELLFISEWSSGSCLHKETGWEAWRTWPYRSNIKQSRPCLDSEDKHYVSIRDGSNASVSLSCTWFVFLQDLLPQFLRIDLTSSFSAFMCTMSTLNIIIYLWRYAVFPNCHFLSSVLAEMLQFYVNI